LGIIASGSVERQYNDGKDGVNIVSGDKSSYWLSLTSHSKEISVSLSTEMPDLGIKLPPKGSTTDHFHLSFSDESIAKRVLEAFHHASDLCRKKDAF
jgi:hypothetical protein